MSKITKALIYESQGLRDDALRLYGEILEQDPQNKEALLGTKRVSKVDNDMLRLFYSSDKSDIDRFKRWLVDI